MQTIITDRCDFPLPFNLTHRDLFLRFADLPDMGGGVRWEIYWPDRLLVAHISYGLRDGEPLADAEAAVQKVMAELETDANRAFRRHADFCKAAEFTMAVMDAKKAE